MERAVLTIVGRDAVGILAKAATCCAEANVNVIEVSQSVVTDIFTMMMMVDVTGCTCSLHELENAIKAVLPAMEIHLMHENIFDSMHRI